MTEAAARTEGFAAGVLCAARFADVLRRPVTGSEIRRLLIKIDEPTSATGAQPS
jgi:hypothetical protein